MVRKLAGVPGGGVTVFDREMLSPSIKAIADLAEDARFTFRTKAMQDLWDLLVTGQITDGIWENSKGRVPSLFWSWMTTGTGGSTSIRGAGPNALRTNYPLRKEILKWSGADALKLVQKTEPDATLEDVGEYLDEIAGAMKKVKTVKIRAPEMDDAANVSDVDKMRHELKWKLGLQNAKVESETLLEGTGGRSGQYHFFTVFYDPETEEYVGGSAYGRFGKAPKSVQIARGPDKAKVEKKVNTKMRAKERKGYYPSKGRLAMQRRLDDDMAAYGKRWFKKNLGGKTAMQRMARRLVVTVREHHRGVLSMTIPSATRVAQRFLKAANAWERKLLTALEVAVRRTHQIGRVQRRGDVLLVPSRINFDFDYIPVDWDDEDDGPFDDGGDSPSEEDLVRVIEGWVKKYPAFGIDNDTHTDLMEEVSVEEAVAIDPSKIKVNVMPEFGEEVEVEIDREFPIHPAKG